MPKAGFLSVFLLGAVPCALAQSFSSGSTGTDGALNITQNTTVQLPASGILNYTTVNVPAPYTLFFSPNVTNTPVTMLATGAVTIGGSISVSAANAFSNPVPGPGGFYAGALGQNGVGPGGGIFGKTDGTQNGQWVGPLGLVPIVGGSGGAGSSNANASFGGGGGGAIVIASSTSIAVTGNVLAQGGPVNCTCAGSGANGAVRLVSNSINVSGPLQAAVVRLEGPSGAVHYTGTGTPPVIAAINPLIVPVNPPSISITSIGGYAAPPATGATWKTVDLLLPTQLTDPIAVIIQGNNLPTGAQASLSFSGSPATASPGAIALSGSSSGTFTVSGLSRTAVTVIFAVVAFNPALLASNLRQSGPDGVAKVELAAAIGQPTKYRFLRADGSEVALASVAPELRRILGM